MFALRRKRWKMVKLSKIITQVRGVSYKPNDVILEKKAGYTCLLRANNIDRGELKFDDVVYVDSARVKNTQLLRAEDILICASSGSRHLVGKAACVIGDMNVTFGAFCKVIRPLAEYAPFLGWFFKSPRYRMQISNASAGVNINNIRAEDIDNMEIDLLTVKQREEAVRKLNAITHLISLRQRQAEKLDELVKARFVGMFGDPVLNYLHIEACPMTEICQIIDGDRGKNYPKAEDFFDKGDCLFLNAKNVTKAGFNFDECMFITKDKDNVLRKGKLQRGDIILTTRGTIGNLALYTDDVPYSDIRINSGMVILRMNREYINPIYFIEQFKMQLENIKRKIASGTAQPQLPISTMNKINVIVPDIRLQANFANFVHEIDREKERIQKSAALLETLKRSLMQQYFG